MQPGMWENTDHAQVARKSFTKPHDCIFPRAVSRKMHILAVTATVLPAVSGRKSHFCFRLTGSAPLWIGKFSFQLSYRKCFPSCPLSISYQGLSFSSFRQPPLLHCTLSLSLGPHPSDPMSPPCTHRPISSLQQLSLQAALQEVWTTTLRTVQCLQALTD